MFDELLLHQKTADGCREYLKHPSQGLMLVGPLGSGKQQLALSLGSKLLNIPVNKLGAHPYFLHINPEGETISIEEVRSIQQFLKLKTLSANENIKRIILVSDAGRMRVEAQNALLKTLEEPPIDTVIIMTVHHIEALLPTIISRVTSMSVLPISEESAFQFFKTQFSEAAIKRAFVISQGQAGLLFALLQETDHPLIDFVKKAKDILSKTPGQRLLITEEFSKDRSSVQLMLNALLRITHAALAKTSKNNDRNQIKKWHSKYEVILRTTEYAQTNANTKLLLDELFLNI
ncbi:hypothetical protein H0V99_03060 [Candidatus Saccharibacteria bacterium]|nr:hypothetical protein [Candidatus Saccharibacteria bacterium]